MFVATGEASRRETAPAMCATNSLFRSGDVGLVSWALEGDVTGQRNRSGLNHDSHSRTVVGAVVGIVLLLGMTYILTGFPVVTDYSSVLDRGFFPDVIHERASAWEAIWGDPHRPIAEIMEDHGYQGLSGGIAPRPPSALLLQTPLVLIPQDALMPVVTIVILLLLTWIGRLVHTISGVELWKLLWTLPLVIISLPIVASISYSPLFGVLSVALILASWRYQDRPWAGVLLGLSAALRLWPGLVIIGFWIAGKRSLAYKSVATFLVVSFAAVLLPGVELGASITSLLEAESTWLNHNMNSSLALVLWPYGVPAFAATIGASLIGLFAAYRNPANAVPITLIAGLIASPLSWPTYALAALPVAALYARTRSPIPILAMAVPVGFWSLLFPS